MRALMTLVVGMGVLIVAGVVGIAVTVAHRMSGPTAVSATVLEEPAGTRMQSLAVSGDRIGILLAGGGLDRMVMIDARSGHVVGRVGLAR